MGADDILDQAQQWIDAHGYDPATVLGAALLYLAISWAEDERPLCPDCGRHHVPRGGAVCAFCRDTYEAKLLAKRRWWEREGNDRRLERRAEANGTT